MVSTVNYQISELNPELLEKLANYVSSDELDNYYYSFYYDPFDTVVEMFALSAYDRASGSNDPNLNLEVITSSPTSDDNLILLEVDI